MKKIYITATFFITMAILVMNTGRVKSNLAFPQPGNCGDPFSDNLNGMHTTCSQSGCHPPGDNTTIAATASDVTLTIGTGTPTTPLDGNFKYDLGASYNIAFLIDVFATNNPYYGFQIIAETASGDTAGSFTVTNAAQTHISTSPPFAGHNYMGHLNAGANHNWVFKWNAPHTNVGPVTFYYAFNVASFTGTPPPTTSIGDIYTGTVTIQPNSTGIADINNKLTDLAIYPNPVGNQAGVSFNLKNTEDVSAKLFSLDGSVAKELMNEKVNQGFCNRVFDMNNLSAGVYLLKLQVGDAYVTKKIVKE